MDLTPSNVSVIRSIKQRELLNEWLRLFAPSQSPPRFDDFQPDRIHDEMPDILLCAIEPTASGPRLIIERDSARMHPAFGPIGKGRELAEYVGPEMAAKIMPFYFEAIKRQRPVYTISRMTDRDGRPVDYERLLLTFEDGGRPTHILASLKAISEDGHFEIADLMRSDSPPKLVLAAVIVNDLKSTSPSRATSGEIELL